MAVKPLPVHGADLSNNNTATPDLKGARRKGLKWVYLKASEGTTYKDPTYIGRRTLARAAGLKVGAYHFARPDGNDAVDEAHEFIAYAKPVPGDLRPVLDLEVTGPLSATALRAWAKAFVDEVERLVGVKPIVYSNFDLGDAVKGCLLWRARYSDFNGLPALRWDIWQFTDGKYGVPNHFAPLGRIDLNTMRKGLRVSQMVIPKKVAQQAATPGKTQKGYRDADLRGATLNTHMGRSISNGTLAEVNKQVQPHFILLQEVSPSQKLRVKATLRGSGWEVYGTGDSLVCIHASRLQMLAVYSPENSHGERTGNDKARRVRYATQVKCRDKVTGRIVYLSSVHCQPLGQGIQNAPLAGLERQTAQLMTFVTQSQKAQKGEIAIDGGDFNQPMWLDPSHLPANRRAHSAYTLWAKAGMSAASAWVGKPALLKLDEFFVTHGQPQAKVTKRALLRRINNKGDDHTAVEIVVAVKKI